MVDKALTPITETVHTRAPFWNDVPDEKWMDWRWQKRSGALEALRRCLW